MPTQIEETMLQTVGRVSYKLVVSTQGRISGLG